MRHADSQDASDVRDHDRTITEAGKHSAAEVGMDGLSCFFNAVILLTPGGVQDGLI